MLPCTDTTATYFSETELERQPAVEACRSCPLRRECLTAAVKGHEGKHGGVWGGAQPAQLRRMSSLTKRDTVPLTCAKCGKPQNWLLHVDAGKTYCCD